MVVIKKPKHHGLGRGSRKGCKPAKLARRADPLGRSSYSEVKMNEYLRIMETCSEMG